MTTYVLRGLSYTDADRVARQLQADGVPARINRPRAGTGAPVMSVDADRADVEGAVLEVVPTALWVQTGA